MTRSIFEVPDLFELVDPPREAFASLFAGHVVLLTRLDDEDLESIGLSPAAIDRSIQACEIFTDEERSDLALMREQIRNGQPSWVLIFAGFLVNDEGWRDFVSLHWCLRNPYFDEGYLSSRFLGTTANTMLELCGLGATVNDVHAAYAEIAIDIANGKLSGTEEGLLFTGNLVAGGLIGFFTAGTGVGAAIQASSWFDEKLRQVDDWASELALELLVANALQETRPDVHEAIALKILNEARGTAERSMGSSSDRQRRMLLNAYRGLTPRTDTENGCRGEPIPDFTGQPVREVKRYLATMGLSDPIRVDATNLNSSRGLWDSFVRGFTDDESELIVCAQIPAPGRIVEPSDPPVRIAHSRRGERFRIAEVRRVLEREF